MSIAGIGTDIVSKQRISDVLEANQQRFMRRLLTKKELQLAPKEQQQLINFISKRWAAKEAISKSFGTGIGKQLSFQDIEISHLESGAPIVVLSDSAQQLASSKSFNSIMLSLSDEDAYAVAFAIAV